MSVPRLRFKDDDGQAFPAWEMKEIGEVLSIGSGRDYKHLSKGTIPVYGTGGYMLSVNDFLYDGESVCIGRKGTIDKPVLISGKFWTVDTLFYTHRFNLAIPKFIFACFQRVNWKNYNEASGVPSLSKSTIEKIEIHVPVIAEQTKIANFLTAVDEKITHLTQKHTLLTQYKKGVMQQIFSQELRFKDDDGRDFPEWDVLAFGDIFYFIQTNSYSREMLTYEYGNVKNIHYGDIHTKFKSNFRVNYERVPYLCADIDIRKIKSECYCKNGDIVIADASEDYADVGKAIEILEVSGQKLVAGLHTYIARNDDKLSLGFGGYLMQSAEVRNQIKVLATGVSVLSISKGNLGKVAIHLPTKPEQTKITTFLTAIDDKITSVQTQLTAMKQYKQGLLQQMFV
jgi:type I restriction enzyme S subunit